MKDNHFYRQKYKFQENFFEIIDTQEKAYWLGFLFADGNVYKKRNSYYIKLSVCDKEVIERFKQDISAEYPITVTYSNNRINPLYSITICSKKMGLDLIDKGCVPCKSLILEFPKNIPKWLNRHFIRGYFDGDGCVCVYNKKYTHTCLSGVKNYVYKRIAINICGTKEFLSKLCSIINIGHVYKEKRKTANCYRLECQDKKRIMRLYNYLYYKSSFCLYKKYAKFKEFYKKDVHRL